MDERRDWLRIMNASLIYYMDVNPDQLSDLEWAMRVKELEFIRKKEAKG